MSVYGKTTNVLTFYDYATFALLLLVSASVGIYYAIVDRKGQATTRGYFLGDQRMHPIPVGLSLMASFLSANVMLGGSSEVYTQGTMIFYLEIAIVGALFLAMYTFIPLYLRLELTSIYQVLLTIPHFHFISQTFILPVSAHFPRGFKVHQGKT